MPEQNRNIKPMYNASYFGGVVTEVRRYFAFVYHAGTREMVYREVRKKMGDVPDKVISKALKELKKDGIITFEKKVWWRVSSTI